jgi:hypothetical protein
VPGQDPYDEQFLLMATTGILDSRAWSDDHNPKNPPLQHPFAWGYARRRADFAVLVIPFPTKAAADAWFASIAHTVKQRLYDVVAVYSESDLLAYREFAQPLTGYWPPLLPPLSPPLSPPPVPMTPGGIPPRNVLVDAPGTAPQVRGSYYDPYYPSVGAWGYVGQEPPAFDPVAPITAAFQRAFYSGYGRMPSRMELFDYAFAWVIDGYGEAFYAAARSAGSWPTDRAAQLGLVKKQISAHVRQILSRNGL